LHKLRDDYDPTDRTAAMNYLQTHHANGEVVTGLLYLDPAPHDLHSRLNTVKTPLNALRESELCPGSAALEALNAAYR
jgi:2-oxoglutarate ferredoxin oxidoreductase subunit beta